MRRSAAPLPATEAVQSHGRFAVLDGWRGISILLILATHLLPIGPSSLHLNSAAGSVGMSLFFAMSGFLIATQLIRPGGVGAFFIRRLFRIVPLAWLYLVIVLTGLGASVSQWVSHLTFSVNYRPEDFEVLTLHFWSLCVEVHFYIAIGLLVALCGRRGLLAIPVVLVLTSLGKVLLQPDVQMSSHLRWDEIMGGVVLALVYNDVLPGSARIKAWLPRIPVLVSGMVLVLACLPQTLGTLQWLRPYAAMALVGATLYAGRTTLSVRLLSTRPLAFLATISYALYVIHPLTAAGWLGQSSGPIDKYLLKRPITFALSFLLAYLSTHYYERHFIQLGKRIIARRAAANARPADAPTVLDLRSPETSSAPEPPATGLREREPATLDREVAGP